MPLFNCYCLQMKKTTCDNKISLTIYLCFSTPLRTCQFCSVQKPVCSLQNTETVSASLACLCTTQALVHSKGKSPRSRTNNLQEDLSIPCYGCFESPVDTTDPLVTKSMHNFMERYHLQVHPIQSLGSSSST